MQLTRQMRRPLVAVLSLFLVACGSVGSATTPSPVDVGKGSLQGAGATFPEPFYTRAFYAYSQLHPAVTVNYQAIGSGGGIKQFTAGTVDFGASDVPMTDAELAAAGGDATLVEVPTILGVVSIAYNLAGVTKVQLDGPTLADIFLGKITRWDDGAIKRLNAGVTLPGRAITTVHRADGSGTTYTVTDYLAKVSPDWKTAVGVGKSVQWKGGTGATGNAAVAAGVKATDGALGYVELAYVVQTGMSQAFIKNAAGKFVQGSVDGATAAAKQTTSVGPTNFSITNEPGDTSYPIAAFSWVFIKKAIADPDKGRGLVNLFKWILTDGQAQGRDLQYAALPAPVQTYSLAQLKLVLVAGKSVPG